MGLKINGTLPAFNNSYHFNSSPKYRKSIFTKDIATKIYNLIDIKCNELDFILHSSVVDADHIHFIIESIKDPSNIAHRIFGYLAFALRKEFPKLKDLNQDHLWGGTQCKIILNEKHFKEAINYVNTHKMTELE